MKLSSAGKIEELGKKGQLQSVLLPHLLWVASNLQYFWRGKEKKKKSGEGNLGEAMAHQPNTSQKKN